MLKNDYIVFDLDDTLYKERTYSESALSFFGRKLNDVMKVEGIDHQLTELFDSGHTDAIGEVCDRYDVSDELKSKLLRQMRGHPPEIVLTDDALKMLTLIRELKIPFSILTDGRSITQRAKLTALGLNDAQITIVSEEFGQGKPSPDGYRFIESHTSTLGSYVYIGDNLKKDFIGPNSLGWKTIQLIDNGLNIHKAPSFVDESQKAHHAVRFLTNVIPILS